MDSKSTRKDRAVPTSRRKQAAKVVNTTKTPKKNKNTANAAASKPKGGKLAVQPKKKSAGDSTQNAEGAGSKMVHFGVWSHFDYLLRDVSKEEMSILSAEMMKCIQKFKQDKNT